MCENLVEIIEENKELLSNGHAITVLFEDGLATIYQDDNVPGESKIITMLEEVEYRVLGSIHDFQKD